MNEIELNEKIAEISKTILSYSMAKTSTIEDAEDLSQDIMYELVKSANSIRNDNAFYGFMWSVAGNVCKQWYRKKAKNVTCELTDDISLREDPSEFDSNEDMYILRRELTLLSQKYRRATILYYIDCKSCGEISMELGVSENMVKYLLFKSRKILKEGMSMERNLGELSYNPKTLIPMYRGQGPNRYYEFMQSKIRQNIVSACYNDSLTIQQISIETGIPLPYLDDEVKALEEKNIIVRDGTHYRSNVIVISSECSDEIERAAIKYHSEIADKINAFINNKLDDYKDIGFKGSDFSDNTLRWQLATVVLRTINFWDYGNEVDPPKTGWGENAYIWCVEKLNKNYIFKYSGVTSKNGDSILFFDYSRDGNGKGDHHDFYGNDRYINIFCDICRGDDLPSSEYDLEAVAEMIKKGYIIKDGDLYSSATPVYTSQQYERIVDMAKNFVEDELVKIIHEMDANAARVLKAHTPKYLHSQVQWIASHDKFLNAVCIPAIMLVDRNVLSTAWHPCEMPTMFVVLNA